MNELNFNIYNITIFAGILQGLIFSFIVLFHKKYKSKTNRFIAFTVLVLSLSNLQYWFIDVDLKGVFSIFDKLRIPCDMLIVPMFFLYVNSYLQNKSNNRTVFLLLSPFFVGLVFNLITYYDVMFSESAFRAINITLESFSLIFNLILIFLILYRIRIYGKNHVKYNKKFVRVETKWLKQLLYIGGAICLFWFVEIIYMQTEHNKGLSIYYPLWISISILVYWISYVGIFNSKIYNERQFIRQSIFIQNSIVLPKESPKKSNQDLYNDIILWVNENKIYLNPDLNINLVSNKFNISNGYFSQLWSANNNLNFNDYTNKLRVDTAKRMIVSTEYINYTIVAIGLESGFNSKSSFYKAFNKFVKQTPTEYKKNVLNN